MPGSEVVAIRAYRQALAAGDMALASRAATVLARSGVAPPDVAILTTALALAAGRKEPARQATVALAEGPLDFLTPVLAAWQAFEAGERAPLARLDETDANPLGRRYATEHRALLLIATGEVDDGLAAVRVALAQDPDSIDLRRAAAELLARAGRRDAARALLAGNDPLLAQERGALGKGRRGTARWATARLLTRVAGDFARNDLQPLVIALTRSALVLDPQDVRARLLLARALAGAGAMPRALATLDAIEASGPAAELVASTRIALLAAAGQTERALADAATLARSSGAGIDEWRTYGDLLVGTARYGQAAAAYGEAIRRAGEGAGWALYLQRGGALEQAGRWQEALPDLERAVALAPEQATALNYLGYAQVERGENLAAAAELLERARALRPDDPGIADSLAWAYAQAGEAARALPLLEEAARSEPGDPTINDHLGDVYWRLGRRYEARYAWRAAAIHAEDDDAARIAAKLATGLAPAARR